jgi:hypothetical protein
MNTNTRATSTIFVILVVTTTSFLLVASGTMAGLAASSDLSHGSSKKGDHSRTDNSVSESGNHIINSTKNNSPSFTTTNENPNLDNLLACESGAANGSGHITMSEVMNCYLQFSRGSASSLAVLGDHQNSDSTGGGGGLGLTSDHHANSKTTTHSGHHKGAADSTSPSNNRTTTS